MRVKTSKPLKVTTDENGIPSFSLNSPKPISIVMLKKGVYELSIANAILEVDMTKEYLSIKAKKIATSIEGLDIGDIYVAEDDTIMVVE